MDKVHDAGLTPIPAGDTVTFEEAEVTLLCRKLFMQRVDPEHMKADIAEQFYSDDAEHDMYIGEVVDIIRA